MITFEQFCELLDKAKIVTAGRNWRKTHSVEETPPLELTILSSQLLKLYKLAKATGGNRLEDFFVLAFVGGRFEAFNGKSRFWTEYENRKSWYENYVTSTNVPTTDYDENGNYTEAAKKRLRKMGFRPK